MSARYTIGCTLLCLTAAVSQGQTWFTQNYHFTGPPAPRAEEPVDPVVADLLEIQRTTMAILRKANFAGDYEAALAAARQAAANAQLIGTLTGRDDAVKRPRNEIFGGGLAQTSYGRNQVACCGSRECDHEDATRLDAVFE